jgi:hypothetical protein
LGRLTGEFLRFDTGHLTFDSQNEFIHSFYERPFLVDSRNRAAIEGVNELSAERIPLLEKGITYLRNPTPQSAISNTRSPIWNILLH